MKPTEEELAELEAEHGKVWLVPFGVDDGETVNVQNAAHVFVIRRPKRLAWERFEKDCLKKDRESQAVKNLAIDCIVWPSKEERELVLEEFPGALVLCGGEAVSLGRGDAAERAKKYVSSTSKLAG